jgi:uncharacterized membrane protein
LSILDRKLANAALMAFGVAYPMIVFFLRSTVDASLFIVMALVVLVLRCILARTTAEYSHYAFLASIGAIFSLAFVDATLASRAYPVVISLAVASLFAITLWHPPSLVEKLALASGEHWSPSLRVYCRNVTAVWAVWLTSNAAIAVGLAIAGDDRAWAIWTGVISYVISGLVFAIEWWLRQTVVGRRLRQ